jgi:hypothetical protein
MSTTSGPSAPAVPHRSMREFYQTTEARYVFHKEKAESHVNRFKPMGFFCGLAIPILSALVTFAITYESAIPTFVTAGMGLVLTLLTIVNSVLKPDKRFTSAAQYCIALHEWKRDFDICVAESDAADEKAFHALIQEMDGRLSEIGKSMAEGWVPKAAE